MDDAISGLNSCEELLLWCTIVAAGVLRLGFTDFTHTELPIPLDDELDVVLVVLLICEVLVFGVEDVFSQHISANEEVSES